MDNRPIGVFDSGLGGLTVLKEMKKLLPDESFIYFGDCGRIPYGTKSRETVIRYTMQNMRFLLTKQVKAIIIACNTAGAYGYESACEFNIPVFEVITPGAKAALAVTENGNIGVIGTPATISSGVYNEALEKYSCGRQIGIYSKACPLFVSLVEEGWWSNDVAVRVTEIYLDELRCNDIDTLILGCTHYPVLNDVLTSFLGGEVRTVSSGQMLAKEVQASLKKNGLTALNGSRQSIEYYTSDSVKKFIELGQMFLGERIIHTENIEIDKF